LRKSDRLINQNLKEYLAAAPRIHPARQLFMDSSLWWAFNGLIISSMAIISGFHDQLEFGLHANHNYLRILQGGLSWLNMAAALILIATGRWQVYRDLADFQGGVEPETIIARADANFKSARLRWFDWLMHETHNNVSRIGIALSLLMLGSGLASQRWGEALTAFFWIWAYLERLRRECYGETGKESKHAWHKKLNDRPLLKSALIQTLRTFPALLNALIIGDLYQTAQFSLLIAGLFCLSNSTKDGIGRFGGSLISEETENGAAIAKAVLKGRLKT
jgi:hypothetical protein